MRLLRRILVTVAVTLAVVIGGVYWVAACGTFLLRREQGSSGRQNRSHRTERHVRFGGSGNEAVVFRLRTRGSVERLRRDSDSALSQGQAGEIQSRSSLPLRIAPSI